MPVRFRMKMFMSRQYLKVLGWTSRRYLSSSPNLNFRAAVVGVYESKTPSNEDLTPCARSINDSSNGRLLELLNNSGKGLKRGKARVFHGVTDQYSAVTLTCLGSRGQGYCEQEEREEGREAVREAVAAGVSQLQAAEILDIDVDPCGDAQAAAEGVVLKSFSYDELKEEKSRTKPVRPSLMSTDSHQKEAWSKGVCLGEAQNWARSLMEAPANLLTPTTFVDQATKRLEGLSGVQVTPRDEAWAEDQGMGGLLAVSKGSDQPCWLLEASYTGRGVADSAPHVAVVGKGVTFDTGGVSIKPSAGMEAMRADMGGAACTVATLWAAAKLQLPLNLKVYVPLCENMVSGRATRPGDVITARSGKTIQVDNTDAEGRLILADALHYAAEFKPAAMLDMATLTGAMMVALGSGATGVFSTSGDLWDTLHKAGGTTGDRVWRMPLMKHYTRQIAPSHLADVNNIGKHGREAGSCTAAAFLKEFVGDTPWMHLDIAGVMENKDEVPYLGRGMSGRPTRTVVEFLRLTSQRLGSDS